MGLYLCLCAIAFLAGFVDSVVGGGGLIQIPALLIALPQLPIATLLGTNKVAGGVGTLIATARYMRNDKVQVRWNVLVPTTILAFVFSMIGARCVVYINPALVRPGILLVLLFMLLYTALHKDFGAGTNNEKQHRYEFPLGLLIGSLLGFYDGFLGPGTGAILMFCYTILLGYNLLNAGAAAKVINLTTNVAAAIVFMATGHVNYHIAIPMAVCNVLGAITGTRMVFLKGNVFVRRIFICVVLAAMVKLGLG